MNFVLFFSTFIFFLAALFIMRKERLAFYHPLFIFLLWHFLGYVFIPWEIWWKKDWSYLIRLGVPLIDDTYLIKTLLLVNLGFVSLLAGYFVRNKPPCFDRYRLPGFFISWKTCILISMAFMALAAYSMLRYHYIPSFQDGSPGASFSPFSKNELGATILTGASGYGYSAYNFLTGVCLLWFFLSYRRGGMARVFAWALIGLYVGLCILKGWHRASWLLALFGLASLRLIQQNRRWPSLAMVLSALPLLLIFNISAVDRQAWMNIIEEEHSLTYYVEQALERITEKKAKSDISNYEYNTFLAMLYPERIPYEWGRVYLNNWIISALPRIIFKNKDQYMLTTNISITDDAYYTVGPCQGIYLEFYTNFGISGIVLGCFLMGLFLRSFWIFLLKYSSGGMPYEYSFLLYAGILTFFPQLFRDGLITMVAKYFFLLTPILLVLLFSKKINYSHLLQSGALSNFPSNA